ncbi:MAG: hypothetical protein MZU95_13955 [Desulfomicrobium escambiense]|nr:hypothetical protein [Desulfomicrobium escambiense]
MKDVLLPAHVVQRQGDDLPAAQSIHREKQQNGAIADVLVVVRVGAGDEPLYVFPLRPDGQCLVAEQTWALDAGGQTRRTPALLTGVTEEAAQGTRPTGHRDPAPTLFALEREKGVDLFEAQFGKARRPAR